MKTRMKYLDQFQDAEAAASYDAGYAEGGYASVLYQIEKEHLQKTVSLMRRTHRHIEMLDFACGSGRITCFLESQVDKSVGIDISSSMLERARHRTRITEFHCGDLTTESSLCPGPFDLIVVFRFITNAEQELREAALHSLRHRLRDKDSRLIFNVHRNLNSYLLLHWAIQRLRSSEPDHDWHYMSMSGAWRLASRCGLQVEHITSFGFLSSHIAKWLPYQTAIRIERMMSRIPGLKKYGSEFIVVCRSV